MAPGGGPELASGAWMTLAQLVMLALPASIILTVFGFGLQTTLTDVVSLTRRPSLLLRSGLAMFVIMPVLALLLVRWLELHPSVEIALVALAISPIPPLLPGLPSSPSRFGCGFSEASSIYRWPCRRP
jgi:hypothetical protein